VPFCGLEDEALRLFGGQRYLEQLLEEEAVNIGVGLALDPQSVRQAFYAYDIAELSCLIFGTENEYLKWRGRWRATAA